MLRMTNAWLGMKLSLSTMVLVGLFLAGFQGEPAPAQEKKVNGKVADKVKERRFDSKLAFLVFQVVQDRSQPRFIGMTPTANKKGVVVPEDDEKWFVVPTGPGMGAPLVAANTPNGKPGGNPMMPGGTGILGGPGMGALGTPGGIWIIMPGYGGYGFYGIGGFGGVPGSFGGGFGSGLPGNPAVPGAFTGNPIPGPGPQPAPSPTPGRSSSLGHGSGNWSPVSVENDASFVQAPKVDPPKVDPANPRQPFNPAIRKFTRAMRRHPVTEAAMRELVAEMQKANIPGICFENADFKDSDLARLVAWTGLKTLILRNTSVTEDGLAQLDKLTQLRHLVLDGDDYTAKALTQLKDRAFHILELGGTKLDNDNLQPLENLKEVKVLRLRWTKVGDDGLKRLAEMKSLNSPNGVETLELLGQQFTDAGLKHLAGFQGLKKVRLYLTQITSAGLDHLSSLPYLTALTVNCISDGMVIPIYHDEKGVKSVRAVPSNAFGVGMRLYGYHALGGRVQAFTMEGPIPVPAGIIINEGLEHIKTMKTLKELEINTWEITDAGVASLQKMTALTSLKLDSPMITNKGLALLKDMTNLETLDVRCTRSTAAAAPSFRNLKSLKRLYVSLHCTNDDVAAFRRTLPASVQISRGNPYEDTQAIFNKQK